MENNYVAYLIYIKYFNKYPSYKAFALQEYTFNKTLHLIISSFIDIESANDNDSIYYCRSRPKMKNQVIIYDSHNTVSPCDCVIILSLRVTVS